MSISEGFTLSLDKFCYCLPNRKKKKKNNTTKPGSYKSSYALCFWLMVGFILPNLSSLVTRLI